MQERKHGEIHHHRSSQSKSSNTFDYSIQTYWRRKNDGFLGACQRNHAQLCQQRIDKSHGQSDKLRINANGITNLIGVMLKLIIIGNLLTLVQSNGIYMTISSTSQYVGSSSNYTINFNRSLNSLGQQITSSSLSSNYLIAIIFDPSYNISSSASITPNTYSLNTNTYTATLTLTSTINSITISSIINPLPSQTPLKITLNFYNSSSPSVVVDTCSATLTFQPLVFSSSAISYQFTPGNVSTQSNITINFIPFIWSSTQMILKLNFLTYWARNMLNVSSNQVLSTMSFCQPTCTISNMGSFFLVQFNSLTLVGTNISVTIFNILSPATLEPADTITITILQTTYSTAVQSGSLPISAATPNNLQIITTSTNSTIGTFVTLTITIVSQDLFSTSDSIIIIMNTPVAMASSVTIANILVASNDVSVQQNAIVTLSNFILVTNIPGQFSGSITITNISSQSSVKPVTGNKISFYRNGYLYDQSFFSFNVNQVSMSSINLTLGSNQANANTGLTISIVFAYGVYSSDVLYVNIDQAIAISTCNVISCSSCSCQITFADQSLGIFSNKLKITNFGTSSSLTSSIIIILSIKNPISSSYVLYFTATDSANFTKQVGSQNFPNITQSIIPSSIFNFNNTSNGVYQPTNFTIKVNFTGYSLLNGWMTIMMDSSITLLDPANYVCLVNGNNGACTITVVNASISANVSISAITQFYTININNLRNPASTKYFSFKVNVYDINNLVYYTLTSTNYGVTFTYQITPMVTQSNCMNSASNIIAITFPYLPFLPSNALLIDDPTALALKGEAILKKLVYPINFSSNISLTITNSYSLEPIYYQLVVVTNDLLYSIFAFNFTLTNCNSSNLPIISYGFTGLPESSGSLSFVINQVIVQNSPNSPLINGLNYLTVLFPSQYASNMTIQSNALATNQLGPRYFNLTIGTTQPISINIWGFTNVIAGFITIQAYSLSQSNNQYTYLVSSNANTMKYNLSLITNCTFPCKICTNNNNSACLQCYSSATTQYYFIDPIAQSCVAPSSCSSNTYANYTSNSCGVCPIQCSTCTSPSVCLSCTTNYYLLNNSCLTDCPSGYYPINIQQICAICNSVNNSAHCATCITINICSTCLYPYYLSPSTKTCTVSCSSNEIPLNNTCFSCQAYCSTCQGSLTNCTSCVTGYYLLSNGCVSICPSPYVPSATTKDCINCSSICQLCMNNPTTCTSCQYPLKLFNSTCINNCPVGYYTYAASNNTLQCLSCPVQCSSCISQSNCSACVTGFYFYNNYCIPSCPISTFSNTITNNNTITTVCLPCISFCLACSSSNQCSQCQSAYYISTTANGTTACVSACSIGQYLDVNLCLSCSSNCISCIDSSLCLLCSTAYSLQNSLCVSSCSTGYVSVLDNVVLPSSNNTAYICKSCQQIFQYCSTCIALSCNTCQVGYLMNYDKTCVAICSYGYVNISNICVACNIECKACTNIQNNCTSCNQNYVYYKNTASNINQCLASCITGTFVLNGVCTSCSSPCSTCVNSSTLCLTCLSDFYSLVNNGLSCVSSCPSNSYIYNNKCIYCDSVCSLCDANGCLACSPLYYKNQGTVIGGNTYYECYTACPSNIPYLINNTCYECPANCQICTATSCLQCVSGKYAYQLYCLTQCPPGMMPSNGVCILIPSNFTNSTNTTNITMNSTTTANIIIPVPFSISCVIVMSTVMISKLSHPHTTISLAIFGLISVLAIVCNLFYLIKSLTGSFGQDKTIYPVILIIGLLINYVNNIIFLFVSKYTLLRDHQFSCWKRGNVQLIKQEKIDVDQPSHNNLQDHLNSDFNSDLGDNNVPKKFYTYECVWHIVLIIGVLSSQNFYTLVFSKLFDLSIFKATVESVKNLKILNYVWVVTLLAHLICLTSGIIEAAVIYPTSNQYLQHIYESVDLIFLNFICLIFGLLLLRKKRQIWEKNKPKSVGDEANSTKKVIFDHESHDVDMNGAVQNQSEVNGKIKNLHSEMEGKNQEIISSEYKSSTNQQGSALYFERQQNENLDDSQDIKLDNNILWMQIHPDEMAPQLIQKDDSHLFEDGHEVKNTRDDKQKNTLNPDNNLETLDFNKIQPQESSHHSSQSQEQHKNKHQSHLEDNDNALIKQNGEDWPINNNEEGDQNIPSQPPQKQLEVKSKLPSELLINEEQDEANQKQAEINEQAESSNQEESEFDYNNLPSIVEDAENNEKDELQFKKEKQTLSKNTSLKNTNNYSNKNNAENVDIGDEIASQSKRRQEFKHEIDSLNDVSLHEESEDQNDKQLMMEIQQKPDIVNQPAPLQSDKIQSINKEQIASALQQYQQSNHQTISNQAQNREIKTEQATRKRSRKEQSRRQRYIPQIETLGQAQSKQASRISGLYELFNQYQSQGSPRANPAHMDQILNQHSISVHQNSLKDHQISSHLQKSPKNIKTPTKIAKESPNKNEKLRYQNYSKYDPIKQQANQLRMSNSAHNFTNKINQNENENEKQEFKAMLHERDNDNEDTIKGAHYRTLHHAQTQNQEISQSLKKSIYKSINIAKINNRLGNSNDQSTPIELRTVSKDEYRPHTTLKSHRPNRSTPKQNQFSSRKAKNGNNNLSQSQNRSVWKSRLITSSSRQNLNGTARLIQRKSKLADVKAKLESIYLPSK